MAEPTKVYRNKKIVDSLIKKIKEESEKTEEKIRIMHVCGTHEHDLVKAGLRSLLPKNIELIAGPGCPVCVSSAQDVDEVLWIADNHNTTITTFGDMMRVPGSSESLYQAQGRGIDVRIVYGVSDAITIAENSPEKDVIFFSVGFETTSCVTAAEVVRTTLPNFSIYSSHKVIPPAMELLVQRDDLEFQGFLAPGHVSTIIGSKPYEFIPEKYNFPVAISGFEPVDILMGIHSLILQINANSPRVDNTYGRWVKPEGNTAALRTIDDAYVISEARWRGLGVWPATGHEISDKYSHIDAKKKYDIPELEFKELHSGCICDEILIGKTKPNECQLFMKACRPDHPVGACMVSHEGTCNVAATYEEIQWED
ncbi:MAG: hydrogenase formation protein HypD [Candidatus Heimdallarchaeota archaeon]|nr:hydrogenase formation protein HypD [Candidatus Heimdallarchaeota archaeon]MCK4954550.1 hydrogenase formation protein HypD [Candidatus Heimdallarchaeota archaeon]